jgi:hypothetical protein
MQDHAAARKPYSSAAATYIHNPTHSTSMCTLRRLHTVLYVDSMILLGKGSNGSSSSNRITSGYRHAVRTYPLMHFVSRFILMFQKVSTPDISTLLCTQVSQQALWK